MKLNYAEILNTRKDAGLVSLHPTRGVIAKAVGVYAPLDVDVAGASATFIISTPAEDRTRDVVRQMGIKLDNYRTNPVVHYNHGWTLNFPIGHSQDGDGKLTVKRKESGTEATCYFAQSNSDAMQVFGLVEEKVLRAASIHIEPIKAMKRYGDGGMVGLDIEESDMIEWSICDIGMNPEALRKVLDRGKLADRPISEALMKSLAPQAAQVKGLVQGMSLQGAFPEDDMGIGAEWVRQEIARQIETIAKAIPPKAKEEGEEDSKEGEDPKEPADEGQPTEPAAGEEPDPDDPKPPGTPPEATGDPKPAEPAEPAGQPQDVSQKPGAMLLSGMSQAITEFSGQLQQQIASQENQKVVDVVTNALAVLAGLEQECQDAHRAAYGQDMQGQQPVQQPGGDMPEDDAMMKSLTLRPERRMSIKGVTVRLDRLAETAGLEKSIGEQLRAASRVLKLAVEKAVSEVPKTSVSTTAPDATESEEPPAIRKALDEHRTLLESTLNQLKSLRPAAKV